MIEPVIGYGGNIHPVEDDSDDAHDCSKPDDGQIALFESPEEQHAWQQDESQHFNKVPGSPSAQEIHIILRLLEQPRESCNRG